MVEVINTHKQVESFEKPINYDSSNVKFWEELSKTLMENGKGSYLTKAKKFLEDGCIAMVSSASWICKPIEGYNKKTYDIKLDYIGFNCSCQGFQKKQFLYDSGKTEEKPLCSHVVAVRQFCFLESRKVYK